MTELDLLIENELFRNMACSAAPAVAPACTLAASLLTTEVVKIVTGSQNVLPVPHYIQIDMYRRKLKKGYFGLGGNNPLQRLKTVLQTDGGWGPMKRLAVISVLLTLWCMVSGAVAGQLSPDEVAWKIYHRDVGHDMQLVGTMELVSSGGQKRVRDFMTLRLDSEDTRKVLIRFTSPADIAGTGFLVLETIATGDTEQHLYLPALKRTRRIVASQQGRSFVNSDFTYEDMQRQPLKNWSYQLDADSEYLGRPCHVLISEPRLATDTQYSRIVSLVDAETYMPLKIDFFDRKKHHSKSYRVEKIAMVDGIATEMEVVMEDLLSAHTTRLLTGQVRYNSGLSEALFTTRALEQ